MRSRRVRPESQSLQRLLRDRQQLWAADMSRGWGCARCASVNGESGRESVQPTWENNSTQRVGTRSNESAFPKRGMLVSLASGSLKTAGLVFTEQGQY